MKIKRVEIIGFKSFCDRAVVQIGESITGVVGPNGCGKSNIVDAIRWCMGEQSAKHLRGKAMDDVIFAGSESRGPAPMAEVSLTFDDVGYSHEKLELARHSDEAEAERALATIDETIDETVAQVDEAVPGDELAPVEAPVEETAPAEAAAAPEAPDAQVVAAAEAQPVNLWVDAEGNPIASPTEEVTAMLEDAPPAFDFARYTEVTITRRLYRDGISSYFINKTPCRLRDITDFFLGTGIGTKAYAIIEQGRIGQIVSARPQDRRAIIEEAAGITKFKSKKKAAEKKLDQTRQNLMRVSDIVTELDKRMGTLRRQAQKAERYRKYKAEVRDIDLWKASHKWLELASEWSLVSTRLGEARTELEESRAAWESKDAHVVAERAELSTEERRLLLVQEKVYELENRLRLGESKIGFERRESEELDGRVATARAEIDDVGAQRAAGGDELAARAAELAALEDEVAREAAEVEAREAAAGEARQMLVTSQSRLDEARGELGSRRTEIATADTQLESYVRRRDEANRRLERVLSETEMHGTRQKELDRESGRVDEALIELRQTRLDLGSQSEGFTARRALLADESQRFEVEVDQLRGELSRRSSRLTSLREIQERYEGFARGTRAVMQSAATIGTSPSEIHGVVADVVRAPERFEVAVEAILGDRLGGVLVADPGVGLAAVAFLKAGASGRSAFVPVLDQVTRLDTGGEAVAGERHATRIDAVALGDGVLGRMADLVEFADGYHEVGRRLVADAMVVETLPLALQLHASGLAGRVVTLDGDVIDGDGVVAGGSREAQGAGVLAQKREIRDLEAMVERLESELVEATARLHTAKAELKQVTLAIEGLRNQQHESQIAILSHEKDESRVRADLERGRERLTQLGNEQLELEDRMRVIAADESAVRERRVTAEARIGELERLQLDLIADAAGHRERLEDLQHVLTDVRVHAAQLGEKRAAAEAGTLRLQRADADFAVRVKRLEHEIEESERRAAVLREGCDQLAAELAQVREERETESGVLEQGRAAYQTRVSALTDIELATRDLRGRTDRLATEVSTLELRDGQVKMQRLNVEEQVNERYQLEMAAIVDEYHQRPVITVADDERLAELKELIDRMGTDINLTAIEEYAEVSTRFEFLSAQKADLERAVDQLQRAIDKINKTSRKLFKETFDAVNATFRQVFPRLFRGGQAFLSLTGVPDKAADADGDGTSGGGGGRNEVDLLEAGIEILAQPPGKKNSTVEQLSGGEKALTAVALVFSIFLIKPSPFCILDEVDAPLDEANVDRYNEIVREMTDRSQFIVITHNKRTMECADNLYGVTMQEPGVSKLVSVNLSRIGARTSAGAKVASA